MLYGILGKIWLFNRDFAFMEKILQQKSRWYKISQIFMQSASNRLRQEFWDTFVVELL